MLAGESLLQHDLSSFFRIEVQEIEKDVSQSNADIDGNAGRVWWADRVAMLHVILGCWIGRDMLGHGLEFDAGPGILCSPIGGLKPAGRGAFRFWVCEYLQST